MRSIVILFVYIATGCTLCGNDPINAEVSPDEERVAIAFIRSCGATTPFYTQVSILDKPGRLSNEAGNIFIVEGKHPVSVQWENNEKLKIGGTREYGEESLRLSEYKGIRISYE